MNVWIIGAGSIGNHLAQASRAMGWSVTVTDTDSEALRRMREEIYPTRYGAWDEGITLVSADALHPTRSEFDIIMIGTPPESHVALAQVALTLSPKLLHIEKPLCTPSDDLGRFQELLDTHPETIITVGYDHAIAPSVQYVTNLITDGVIGDVLTIDAMTRESFRGVLAAHPWLAGVHETYLGYWRRGGGALCEHSHAFHLGLEFAEAAGWRDLRMTTHEVDVFRGAQGEEYDRLSHLVLRDSEGRIIQVTQDVVTVPTRKEVWVQGTAGRVEIALSAVRDIVRFYDVSGKEITKQFDKKRTDDFLALVRHYDLLLRGRLDVKQSPVHVDTGMRVMRHIKSATSKIM